MELWSDLSNYCCSGSWGSLPVFSPPSKDRYSSKFLCLLLFGKENWLPCPGCSAGDLCAPFLASLSALLFPEHCPQPRSDFGKEQAAFSPPEWRSEDEERHWFLSMEGPVPESVKPLWKNCFSCFLRLDIKAVSDTEHQNLQACEGQGKGRGAQLCRKP